MDAVAHKLCRQTPNAAAIIILQTIDTTTTHHRSAYTYTTPIQALQETPTSVHSFTPSGTHSSTITISSDRTSVSSPGVARHARRQIPSTRKFACSIKALHAH